VISVLQNIFIRVNTAFDTKLYSGRIKVTHILYGFVSHPLHVFYDFIMRSDDNV